MMAKYLTRNLGRPFTMCPTPTKLRVRPPVRVCVLRIHAVPWEKPWFAFLARKTHSPPTSPPHPSTPPSNNQGLAPPEWSSSPSEAGPGRHQVEQEEEVAVEAAVAGDGGTSVDEAVDGASQAVVGELALRA